MQLTSAPTEQYLASKNPTPGACMPTAFAACASGLVSMSSSDFDIVVSEDRIVIEFTQEGFDYPKSSDIFHLPSSAPTP